MPRGVVRTAVGVGVIAAIAAGLGVYFLLPSALVDESVFRNASEEAAKREEQLLRARNDIRISGVACLTLIGVVVGSVLTWRTVRLTREGQHTDRFANAMTGLSSGDKAVQLGAIYALEGVARSSRTDHWTVINMLTQYVRQEAGTWNALGEKSPTAPREVPSGVNEAVEVIGRRRRRWDKGVLDLSGVDLRNVTMIGANLRFANLSESNLCGAFLNEAKLNCAKMINTQAIGCHMEGASLRKAILIDAVLDSARLAGADFRKSDRTRCSLQDVRGEARGL